MILWTIQPENVWGQLQFTGELRTNTEAMIADHEDFWASTQECYEWLAEQMSQRISPRPTTDAFPLWGWYQCTGAKRKRPDLRQRSHVPRGTKAVRLEIELPDEDVLLSDFEMWHVPLNRQYLAVTAKEDREWDKLLVANNISVFFPGLTGLPDALRQQKEKSW